MRSGARGSTLVEALVALVVMGLGLLGTLALQGRLRHAADDSHQRVVATAWAQAHWDALHAAWLLNGDSVLVDVEDTHTDAGTDYVLARHVSAQPGGWDVDLDLRWQGREGEQHLRWRGGMAAGRPELHAAVAQGPADGQAWLDGGRRHGASPPDARRTGPGSSVWAPDPALPWVWRLDERTGQVTHRCDRGAQADDNALDAADPAVCSALPQPAVWVTGHVRLEAGDAMPAFGMSLRLSSLGHPSPPICWTRTEADRSRYACLVTLRTPDTSDPVAHWSGRLDLTGLDWGTWRACRYSVDLDHNQRIDNEEHPEHYQRVTRSLAHQHFLLRRADLACPADETVPHQP